MKACLISLRNVSPLAAEEEQVQALQAQPAASSAKPQVASPKKESDAAVQQRRSVAFQPPRPKRPSAPWRPRPYMDGPYYDDPYW